MERESSVKVIALSAAKKALRYIAGKSAGVQCSYLTYEPKMPKSLKKE